MEFLSLKRGCSGSSASTLVKIPHCWKSHVTAHYTCYYHFRGSLCDINVEECHYPTMVGENMSPGKTTCVLRDLEVLIFKHEYGPRGEAMLCHQGLRPVEAHCHLA